MSGISLRYPFKPSDLADDLESFVHVICHTALQFHEHDMTPRGIISSQALDVEKLKEINCKNLELAEWVSIMYYQSAARRGGIQIGGKTKIERSKAGSPGFTLIEEDSPLSVLIRELYLLLQTHHASIDFDDLKRYAANDSEGPTSRKIRNYVLPVCDPLDLSLEIGQPLSPTSTSLIPPSVTATTAVRLSQPPTARRVLDTHDEMLKAFAAALQAMRALYEEMNGSISQDKTMDQFLGLPGVVLAGTRGPTGSKRKSTDARSQHGSGRPTKIANTSAALPLTSLQEDKG